MAIVPDLLVWTDGGRPPGFDPKRILKLLLIGGLVLLAALFALALAGPEPVLAAGQLPGEDASSKLEAAGTLLKILDTGLFSWGARIFAGICIMSSAWALKEQRFGIAIICVVGAIVFGTAPKWVKNIFEVGGNQGIFSHLDKTHRPYASFDGPGFQYGGIGPKVEVIRSA